MQKPNERLIETRRVRFPEATQAANAMGVKVQTYLAHENGNRGLTRAAPRYAAFFRVSLDWLLTGRGPRRGLRRSVPLVGYVGAGATVLPVMEDTAGADPALGEIDLPDHEFLGAYKVQGDSQYPRYLDGEIVLFDTREVAAGRLLNQYAVVDLVDGRRLLKMLRRMPEPGRFRLESHNAAPIDDAEIVAAYAVSGTLQIANR